MMRVQIRPQISIPIACYDLRRARAIAWLGRRYLLAHREKPKLIRFKNAEPRR